jgi:hypothetical protein
VAPYSLFVSVLSIIAQAETIHQASIYIWSLCVQPVPVPSGPLLPLRLLRSGDRPHTPAVCLTLPGLLYHQAGPP